MIPRRKFLALAAAVPVTGLFMQSALAGSAQIFAIDGIAIRGFDPVAYFTNRAVVKGSAEYAYDWNGATWHFASAEKRDMFIASPQAYAPQYGGYCAFAVSKGAVASTAPEAWTVYKDRLYLNYSLEVRTIWSRDLTTNISRADANWPGVLT